MQPRIAVVPGDLHRTATALHDELPRRPAPPPDVDGGWAATAALGLATGAVTDRLAGLVDGGTAIVSALRSAARAYELADDRPQDRWVAAGHELDAAPGRANREPAVRPAVTGANRLRPAPAMTGADLLRAARPAAWNAVAAAWRHLAESLAGRADRIRGLTCRLRGSWSGAAADAAGASLDRYAADLDRAALVCLAVDQVLCDFAARLAVDRPHADDPAARADADGADADAARRLADSVPDLAAPAVAVPPWPAAAGDPAAVRRWWNALTGPQRLALLSADPRRLGGLDGIPVEVRDRANRLLLTGLAARAGFDADTGVDVRAGLNALRARLDRDQPARAYLLGLDPSGDGRAVVAIGDPDRAANIVTYVPGTGSDLAGIGAGCLLPAADRLAARAGASTSVVLWLGYDAPDNPAVAGSEQYAVGAGAALDAFQDGLRDTHEGAPAHRTVLGHSYGSTVVGYTARDRGLATDDTVFVGSPGVGVDHARDLRLDPAHVWSSTAAADPIRLTAVANALPDVLGRGDPHELWFGTDPSSAGFGGRVFDSPPGSLLHPVRTHVGYLDADNPALAEIAAIATRP